MAPEGSTLDRMTLKIKRQNPPFVGAPRALPQLSVGPLDHHHLTGE